MPDAFMRGDVPIVRAPADPWAGRTQEAPIVQRRPIYGRIYETILAGRTDDRDTYVGKTTQTIHQRVHGSSPSAHTSAQSIAKDPWKARILPGRAGYRLLENVYDTGDPAENRRALARAEADWMRRIEPRHNDVLPVKPLDWQPKPKARAKGRPAGARRARKSSAGPVALLLLVALFTGLVARVVVAMELPHPAAPWIAAPVGGVMLAWVAFSWLQRVIRKVKRGFR